jgi:hypothetical protein
LHIYNNNRSKYSSFILIFVAVKVGLNLLAMSHFGFHRDELLHLALGDHLDWGYKEVPPFIALLAKISTTVFGDSVFAIRIFSTIFSGLIIWFTGQIVVELGGRKFAITLACLALIFSPAFAASGYLFQPVVFDQLWWVLTVYLLIRYINTSSPIYLYLLGATIGMGLLTKYTMAFFAIALTLGLLITKQRRILWNRHVLFAALLAFLIFLPNIIWQFQHHLPVVTHMKALRSQQLEYIQPSDFIKQQLLVNGIALFIWLIGFGFLLFSTRLRKFQFLAFAYILIFFFLLEMSGKDYYLFGAYPMLFATGAYGIERWLKSRSYVLRTAIVLVFVLPNLLLFPLVLPVFSLDRTLSFFRFSIKNIPATRFAVTWEDHKLHPLTQDYADMFGWDEMTDKVAKAYNNLTLEQQKNTTIYADNYGEAGAINHLGKKYHLPRVVSLSSSFTLWAPDSLSTHYIIYVDDQNGGNMVRLKPYIESATRLGEVDFPLAREIGTAIFLIVNTKPELNAIYQKELAKKRLE